MQFFALFYLEFEGNFQLQAPGGLYLEGRFIRGFFCYYFGGLIYMYLDGLIHGGAYFGNFTVAQVLSRKFAILCHYVFKVMQIVTGSIYMFLFLQFVTCIGVPMIDYNQPSIKIFKQHDNLF